MRATIKQQQIIPTPSVWGKDKKPKGDDVIYEGLTAIGAIICPNQSTLKNNSGGKLNG